MVRRKKSSVARFSRSPMCWLTNAWRPRVRQTVFFSSAPQANTGGNSSFKNTGTGT